MKKVLHVGLDVDDKSFHIGAFCRETGEIFEMTSKPGENEYFFPDNIILRCPERLSFNKPFEISSIWLESNNQLRTIMASYGADSSLIDVRLQHLSR